MKDIEASIPEEDAWLLPLIRKIETLKTFKFIDHPFALFATVNAMVMDELKKGPDGERVLTPISMNVSLAQLLHECPQVLPDMIPFLNDLLMNIKSD